MESYNSGLSRTDHFLLIFDCDGTLVDSEVLINKFFVDLVREYNIPLTYEEAWKHFPGTSLRLCMDYVEEKFDFSFPNDFVVNYRSAQRVLFAENLQPIAGARECLSELGTFQKCVASNGPYEIIEANLKTTGLSSYFNDAIFSAYRLNKWKPDPALFLEAALRLDFQPTRCIVVEDSEAGIAAGLNAGMKVFSYQPSPSDQENHSPGQKEVTVFREMPVLPQLIREYIDQTDNK